MSEENNYPYRHNTWIGVNPPTLEEILNNAKKAMDEIDEKVRNSIKNFEDNKKLKAENARMREALEKIVSSNRKVYCEERCCYLYDCADVGTCKNTQCDYLIATQALQAK